MTDLVLDASKSLVRIHTFAEGLLARLAHDLELVAGDLSGTATSEGAAGTASIEAPLRGLTVGGIVAKDGHIDERGLSANERKDCIAKMHHDVFHATPDEAVRLEVKLDGDSARVRVVPPHGRAVETVVRAVVKAEGEALRATGSFEISLAAIGSDVVKGPMNAFRVKDKVKVTFDVVFGPAPNQPA